jgi:BASS family bile acid:Na+ symporter
MEGYHPFAARLAHALHRRFLWLLLGCYAAAALWPAPGLWLRRLSLGEVRVLGERLTLSLPLALLAFLLANAGLGVRAERLRGLLRGPWVLGAGLAANLLLPLAALAALAGALRAWHNPDEAQNLLVGVALVAAMPVAGSSAAWSQRADGDLSLSLGLVLGSTLLSPLTTPLALHAAGQLTAGGYADALHGLADSGTGGFLAVGVVAPSLLGLLGRRLAGEARLAAAGPALKLAGSLVLLLLCYVNAAVSLPQAVDDPDWDFLALLLAAVGAVCLAAFAAGWLLGRLLRADAGQRAALTFGLGMNNNGTGLVLAGTALAAFPRVMLPLILYNLVQHLLAGAVSVRMAGAPDPAPPGPAEAPAAGRDAA